MGEGRFDGVAVSCDAFCEFDERADPAAAGPGEPVVEGADRGGVAELEYETELFFQEVGR